MTTEVPERELDDLWDDGEFVLSRHLEELMLIAGSPLEETDAACRRALSYARKLNFVEVPALRERRADIPLLVEYFTHRFSHRAGKKIRALSKETSALLQAYDWPGNIRELQNVIERAVIIADSDILAIDERWLGGRPPAALPVVSPPAATLATHERQVIEAALRESKGRVKIDKRQFKSA